MRPDVKLGVVISMVFLFVAGTYFFYRDKREAPIPVMSSPDDLSRSVATDGQSPSALVQTKIATPIKQSESQAQARGITDAHSTRDAGKERVPIGVRRSTPAQTRPATPIKQSEPQAQARGITDDRTRAQTKAETSRLSDTIAQRVRTLDRRRAGVGSAVEGDKRRPVPLVAVKRRDAGREKNARPSAGEAAVDRHRVQKGDTFSSLAERYYGSAKFARFLIAGNLQIADPNRLRIGQIIKIPPRPVDDALSRPHSASETARPTADKPRTYRVKPGDSFYRIARDVLGDTSRWWELFELNKELVDDDPTNLQVDQIVTLPKQK